MNDHEELTPKQIRTILCLLEAPSLEEGCKRARVGKATVYRWLRQNAFRNELETRRKEMVELAFENLKANATKAVQTLVKHLDSEKGTMSIRAAESILEFAHKGTERQPNKDLPSHETFDLDSYLTDYQKEQLRYGRERRLTLKSSGGSGWDRDK